MDRCDVLIVGGGPAGSSCAWKLRQAGADVVVVDRAVFPRDKVCAGWITPQVIDALRIDCDHYRRRRTLQKITGFRTGLLGSTDAITTDYRRTVSYGIRRCEFDEYLLCRSGARLRLGESIASIRHDRGRWVVNESVTAPMLVGAGGHFCPVAKQLNPEAARTALVVAQEAEFPVPERDASEWAPEPERPELYYCRDLKGYGWCFRKGAYLNVGLGRMDTQSLPKACARFVEFLQARRRVPRAAAWRWRGHAYLVCSPPHRRIADEGVLLVGDAAGLAYSQSGEGIRPAVESGLLAASAILASDRLAAGSAAASYIEQLRARFGFQTAAPPWRFMPDLSAALGPLLLGSSWFVRNVVLDRWFLHARDAALSPSV